MPHSRSHAAPLGCTLAPAGSSTAVRQAASADRTDSRQSGTARAASSASRSRRWWDCPPPPQARSGGVDGMEGMTTPPLGPSGLGKPRAATTAGGPLALGAPPASGRRRAPQIDREVEENAFWEETMDRSSQRPTCFLVRPGSRHATPFFFSLCFVLSFLHLPCAHATSEF